MKLANLYTGIESVDLDRLEVLNEPVIHVFNVLKGMENDIQDIHSVLSHYSRSIQDHRFNELVTLTKEHCIRLNEVAKDLYGVQQAVNQRHIAIAKYQVQQANIIEYPQIEFSFPNIEVDPSRVLFNKSDMMTVWHALGVFCGNISKRSTELRSIPENVPGWRDREKDVLAYFLNDTADELKHVMALFSDYRDHLGYIIIHL